MPGLLNRKMVLNVFLYGLMWCVLCQWGGGGTALSAESKAKLSKKEKRQAVQQAVAQYHDGRRAAAKRRLEQVAAVFPENYAIPYYLGLIYLEEGKKAAAISQWQRYVAMDSKNRNAMKIRKYLTILLREQAVENARKAVAQKAALMKGDVGGNAIAVATFANKGYEIFPHLGKGMAALLIADLSHVPELEVVSLLQLQMLLKEMEADAIGLMDARTAPEVARLLKVKHVTVGSLLESDTKKMQIASVVFNTSGKTGAPVRKSEGALNHFYVLEKEIACRIVDKIGKNCDKLPEAFHKIHTRSLPALVAFSWGLEHSDQARYDKAREMFQKALKDDPEFALAEEALVTTPTSDMSALPISRMIADASSDGKSADLAGSALVVAQSGGISSTKLIVGGLAAAGGIAALAGGGGPPGGGPDPDPDPDPGDGDIPGVAGTWRGTWTADGGGSAGMTKALTQDGQSVGGSANIAGWECMVGGTINNGTFDEKTIRLTIIADTSGNTYSLTGSCSNTECTRINGTWKTASGTDACASGTGSFDITMDSEAEVTW